MAEQMQLELNTIHKRLKVYLLIADLPSFWLTRLLIQYAVRKAEEDMLRLSEIKRQAEWRASVLMGEVSRTQQYYAAE